MPPLGLSQLLKDLKALQKDIKSADLTFYIGPNEVAFHVHSLILQARCVFNGETKLDVDCAVFGKFLDYVYTGELPLVPEKTLDLYCLSLQFELEDLTEKCEEILFGNMKPNSAISLLKEALEKMSNGQKGLDTVISKAVSFVGDNPAECLNEEFFFVTQDVLVAIVSSDQLCLEEEEVWRLVLKWSQRQAKVETHVSQWTEEERLKVSKFLSPVIGHVRLLLIDSHLFANEIEKTGCVPMELSLERYRFAALPHKFTEDSRLTPRNSPRLFQSSIISNDRILLGRKLNEWYGNNKQSWKCIYRASCHGFGAEDFHSRVAGATPTFVICLLESKWICGGYADAPWSQNTKTPKYSTSNAAFLFSYDGKNEPKKFNIVKRHFALCHDPNSGPIFGAGADLYISHDCNQNSDSYSNLPHSYESDGEFVLTPSYHFTILDYEVFTAV